MTPPVPTREVKARRQRFERGCAPDTVASLLRDAAVLRERAERAHPAEAATSRRLRGRAKVLEGTAEVIAAENDLPAPEVPS